LIGGKDIRTANEPRQGWNLAVNILYVQNLLDSGLEVWTSRVVNACFRKGGGD
jgi:hypothetical protein